MPVYHKFGSVLAKPRELDEFIIKPRPGSTKHSGSSVRPKHPKRTKHSGRTKNSRQSVRTKRTKHSGRKAA